ncbi:MAG: GH92 family glycosyl hydrolase [Paraprevotella sp.]|nr:GH92 family glycosyl hydrolase [Paraprevotella sp.]MDY5266105.1 GH92 family glycosyl hydrolase [Bacteroidaceae bacterium]
MKRIFLSAVLTCICTASTWANTEPVDMVNPLTGTLSKFELSTGNNYPVIALPWGMNFWTPQTGKNGDGWQYTYTADKIRGFKQTHQPSPWMNDYGMFSLMPITGEVTFDEEKRASWFSHKAEIAKPYYYRVYLADYDITTEIAPTERAAMFRFTFPQEEMSYVVLDAYDRGSYVQIQPEKNRIVGYTTRNSGGVTKDFKNWFIIDFGSRSFDYTSVTDSKEIFTDRKELKENHTGAIVGFRTGHRDVITARVASSFISLEQAERNLNELGKKSFDEIASDGRKIWNDVLGRIQVEGGSEEQMRTFYSCLWRSLHFPRRFYEIDDKGNPIHYSPYNGQILPGYLFADTGVWDTFRCLFPFLNLVYPSMNEQMQAGLVNAYLESGYLPEWSSPGHRDCMIGQNSASVVADAYIKGIRVANQDKLWDAVTYGAHHHLDRSASGRVGHDYYDRLGYVPCNVGIGQNVARTLEYAYNDWSIYTLGKAMGKSEAELAPYKKAALNYANVYNPARKLMCGREEQGAFNADFVPENWSGEFCEGNSWHWSFCVFHDPAGLSKLMGGRDEMTEMMDSVFVLPSYLGLRSRGMIHEMREMQVMDMGQYAHGNQPIQHMVYLYNWTGQPWKAQYWTREIMDKLYNPNADAYCGDEDNGQTSAWYVFSAMGFYPVCPGTKQYAMGSPLFQKILVKLENGKTIQIEAPDNNKQTRYVKDVKVNGKSVSRTWLEHDELTKGATIKFQMSSKPNKKRGTDEKDAPYSFTQEM